MKFDQFSKGNCQIRVIGGYINTIPISLALAPNHRLFANLSRAMLKIHQNGRVNNIFDQYEKYQCAQEKSNEETPQPLQPKDIAGLFVVVVIKLAMAVVWGIGKKWKKLRAKQMSLYPIPST